MMRKKTMREFNNEFQVVHQVLKLAFRREAASFNKSLQATRDGAFSLHEQKPLGLSLNGG